MKDKPIKERKDRDLIQVTIHSEAGADKEGKKINIKMVLTDINNLNRKEVLKGKNFVIEVLPFLKKRKR
jgi:hypothetical protein